MQDIHAHTELAFPTSLPQFQRLFPDDASCGAYLERIRWEHGFCCPHCGERKEPFRFANRPAVLRCRACRRDIALTAGTVIKPSATRSILLTALCYLSAYSFLLVGLVAFVCVMPAVIPASLVYLIYIYFFKKDGK